MEINCHVIINFKNEMYPKLKITETYKKTT